MNNSFKNFVCLLVSCLISVLSIPIFAAESGRQIEEITVTAEKREATVSDTSISITAFDAALIEDFGIQSADELVNYIPATTRDEYDIRIRGVGRNFRALGGDPGVATYYNSVYSPDFGIAASENALYDLARVEVLRGPQGTLYGRNSIGGALNYVSKNPTFDWTGQLRTQLGEFNTREIYGVVSGPIIDDVLAIRLVAVKRKRDGTMEGLAGTQDVNSTDDSNYTIAFTWNINDNLSWMVRANDRESDRIIGRSTIISEGAAPVRGIADTSLPVYGLREVAATDPGAMQFTNPISGEVKYGNYVRPGLEATGWPWNPAGAYQNPYWAALMSHDPENPRNVTMTNNGHGPCKYPYIDQGCNNELFVHSAVSSELTWEINEDTALKWIFGHNDFCYNFNIDVDSVDVDFTDSRLTDQECVYSYSHELQLNWGLGDRFTATSGVFYFKEGRTQWYSISDNSPRFTEAAEYGNVEDTPIPDFLLVYLPGAVSGMTVADYMGMGPHVDIWNSAVGTSNWGRWDGDPRGDIYGHENRVENIATAVYTQGTYEINDQFQLVMGIRYAKDKKAAREVRGGYHESDTSWANFVFAWQPNAFGLAADETTGLTGLGIQNIAMGNASYSGDPNDPLVLTCELSDTHCGNPLRLGLGVPISYESHVAGNDEWSDVNYRINLDWTPNDDILVYLSVTTGYRAGGYQLGVTDARDTPRDAMGLPIAGSDIEPLTYDKETVRSIELGYKGMHFDNTLQLSVSLYNYDYKGYQDRVNVLDPVRGTQVDIVQNANKATNNGFEVETLWLPTDSLTLGGNYSYTEAYYGEDYWVVITDDPAVPPALFGDALTAPQLFAVNAKGSQLKRIPVHKATVWGSYHLQTAIGSFQFRSTWSYTGEYYSAGVERKLDEVPARDRIDISISWRDPANKWDIRAFVDNVTDERNLRGISSGGSENNWRMTGSILDPRYWGVDIKYNFGDY